MLLHAKSHIFLLLNCVIISQFPSSSAFSFAISFVAAVFYLPLMLRGFPSVLDTEATQKMLKNKAAKFLKRVTLVLASMAKAKTLALKSKTHALKTRLMIFSLLRDKKVLMSSISRKLHSIMGQIEHDKDQEDGDNNTGEQSKGIVLYNHGSMLLPNPAQIELLENADEVDNVYGYGYGYGYSYEKEDGEEKFPDLTHSLFESEDLEFEDPGGSVIDLVKNSKKEGEEFRLEDEIDHVADLFIKRFHRQIRMQKQLSVKRHQEMLERSA